MLDNMEADDKIIAVLENDHIYGHIRTIEELPGAIVERLKHYFSTYKMIKDLKPGIKLSILSVQVKQKRLSMQPLKIIV